MAAPSHADGAAPGRTARRASRPIGGCIFSAPNAHPAHARLPPVRYTHDMSSEAEHDVFSTTLALPARERTRLTHELLTNLDETTDPDTADTWTTKIEQHSRKIQTSATVEN